MLNLSVSGLDEEKENYPQENDSFSHDFDPPDTDAAMEEQAEIEHNTIKIGDKVVANKENDITKMPTEKENDKVPINGIKEAIEVRAFKRKRSKGRPAITKGKFCVELVEGYHSRS